MSETQIPSVYDLAAAFEHAGYHRTSMRQAEALARQIHAGGECVASPLPNFHTCESIYDEYPTKESVLYAFARTLHRDALARTAQAAWAADVAQDGTDPDAEGAQPEGNKYRKNIAFLIETLFLDLLCEMRHYRTFITEGLSQSMVKGAAVLDPEEMRDLRGNFVHGIDELLVEVWPTLDLPAPTGQPKLPDMICMAWFAVVMHWMTDRSKSFASTRLLVSYFAGLLGLSVTVPEDEDGGTCGATSPAMQMFNLLELLRDQNISNRLSVFFPRKKAQQGINGMLDWIFGETNK